MNSKKFSVCFPKCKGFWVQQKELKLKIFLNSTGSQLFEFIKVNSKTNNFHPKSTASFWVRQIDFKRKIFPSSHYALSEVEVSWEMQTKIKVPLGIFKTKESRLRLNKVLPGWWCLHAVSCVCLQIFLDDKIAEPMGKFLQNYAL